MKRKAGGPSGELRRRAPISDDARQTERQRAAERLAEFRRRTAGRGSPSAKDLLDESRTGRIGTLTPARENG